MLKLEKNITHEKIQGIYKITSPSGKVYIGQSIDIINRKRVYYYFKSYKNSIGPKLTNSFIKYGPQEHIFEILEECSLNQLNERETFWKMVVLDGFGNDWKKVLFCGLHDTGGGPKSEETKLKISKGKMGTNGYPKNKKRPESFGKYISAHPYRGDNIKKSLVNNVERGNKISKSLTGKNKTEQHKLNISLSSKGVTRNGKEVNQYTMGGDFIKTWGSISEANKIIKGDIGSAIIGKRQKQAGGFIWKFNF